MVNGRRKKERGKMIKKAFKDKIVVGNKVFVVNVQELNEAINNKMEAKSLSINEANIDLIKSAYFKVSYYVNQGKVEKSFFNNNLQEKSFYSYFNYNKVFFSKKDIFDFIKNRKSRYELQKKITQKILDISDSDIEKINQIMTKY